VIAVVLRWVKSGDQQEVVLSAVPRKGDHIRLLRDGAGSGHPVVVEDVTWMEGFPEPSVILVVRPQPDIST
jgi:hypothetical protein